MNNAEVLIKFKGDTSNVEKTTKSISSSFSNLTKKIALGNIAAKAVSKSMQLISQNMGSAVSRIDTLNNFPKVMKNLGISTKESQKAMASLDKGIQGLPTTLNDAASAVQRFTSANNNVQKSTDIFLAVNNALLAGGASADVQASAMEQLSQAYAKGKPDAMEWRSMLTAMPAQLKQVANSLGYTSTAVGGDFYNAIQKGQLTMDDFMDTFIKLNKEGTGEFASFTEQAKGGTQGIATSVANMKTAIVRGVAELIKSVNKTLKPFGGLSGVISSIGKVGENAFKRIGNILKVVIPSLISFAKWIKEHKVIIGLLLTPILALITAFKTYQTIMSVVNTVQAVYNALMLANPAVFIIAAIVGAIATLVAAFLWLWNNCEGFRKFWTGLWNGISNIVKSAWDFIKGIFDGIIGFIKNNWQAMLLMIVNPFAGAFKLLYDNCGAFRNFINGFVNAIKNFFIGLKNGISFAVNSIVSFIRSIPGKIASVPGIILGYFKGLPSKMLSIGGDIVKGIGRGITNGVGWIKGQITKFVGNVTSFIKKMFKIGSPSRLMEDEIGQWLPKGIAVGISANTDAINNSMAKIKDEMVNADFGLNSMLNNTMGVHYSPNVNVTNNIDVSTDPLGQVVSSIKTFSGGAKNDYNYGKS